jgi:cellulose synthase/poly-beta-1,6-N-acetylglucosamine synthase-like glycosyltransferase
MSHRRPRAHAGEWVRRPGIARPRTTVLMPSYDSHATVREAVQSVLGQTCAEFEVLVVDDAGTTPVEAALADVDDPRLGIFRHERNHNTSGARNTAVVLARAPLVSQLDADDLWEPEYLETVLPLFDDPGVGLVYTNAHIIGHPTGSDDYVGDPRDHPMYRFPHIANQNPIPAPTATMRTAAVRAVGGYDERLWGTSDYDLYLRLAAAGWRFAYVHRRLASYRWPTAQSKSANGRAMERSMLRMWVAFALRHPRIPGPRRQARRAVLRRVTRA